MSDETHTDEDDDRARFPVVGIGASAGGLDALEQFFAHVPPDAGMAFVVVSHTQAGRPSLLPQILGRQTQMPIVEVTGPIAIEPDHVYIAPGGKLLAVTNGVLAPHEPPDRARLMPVDAFFRSLADDRGPYAIGIVLSGTGSDGTHGVREIKAASGLALAQEESSARYPSMPSSAVATELVDYVLPPSEMPERLIAYARHAFARDAGAGAGAPSDEEARGDAEDMQRIFLLLRRHAGHDFSSYKRSTLRRRVERRMNVHHLDTAKDYARFLQANPGEIDSLFHELLIGVTSFFRDPAAYEALERALPRVLAERPDGHVVRAWVPGCSTGEEAYSIAILIREHMDRLGRHHDVQVFATDLDGTAIDAARAGVFPESIAASVTPERLERYFMREDVAYRVRKDLREMIVFAPHNVISDPPFTRLDLLSCRNLLIYLDSDLQARLLPMFHYALRDGGLLFLGSSESVGAFGELFETVDKPAKLFARRAASGVVYRGDFDTAAPSDRHRTRAPIAARAAEPSIANAADRVLFEHLVPPSAIVHESGEIAHIHGRTGELLELPAGPVTSVNLLHMAREGLALDLSSALREASLTNAEVVRHAVRVRSNGHHVLVDLRVERLTAPDPFRGLFLVSFERVREPGAAAAAGEEVSTRLDELERDLQHAKEAHQGMIEELEAANEELKSTNEELQSTNEELQSTNEELETSKEEMQSLNEELQTVNAELQDKLEQLSRTNDDMKNLLDSTDIATVFLDDQLRIKRYTEQAKRVIPLIPADVGRPVGDLVPRLHYAEFVGDAAQVLRTLVYKESEVQSADGKWYLTRIMPYRTADNVIEGLVITFVEITRVRGLQDQAGAVMAALAKSTTAVFGMDRELRYTWTVTPVFGAPPSAVIGKRDVELLAPDAASMIGAIERRVMSSGVAARERVTVTVAGARRTYDAYFEPLRDATGAISGLSGVLTELEATPIS